MKHCEICGQPLLVPGIVDIVDGNPHLICTTCGSKMNTCETCKEISKCDFETNPSPIEKTINKQVRQGNMIMMTTVKNPKRIDETCKKNCKPETKYSNLRPLVRSLLIFLSIIYQNFFCKTK